MESRSPWDCSGPELLKEDSFDFFFFLCRWSHGLSSSVKENLVPPVVLYGSHTHTLCQGWMVSGRASGTGSTENQPRFTGLHVCARARLSDRWHTPLEAIRGKLACPLFLFVCVFPTFGAFLEWQKPLSDSSSTQSVLIPASSLPPPPHTLFPLTFNGHRWSICHI